MYHDFFKRIIDIVLAFFGLLILLPFFAVVFLILLFNNNGKPFFFQKHPGKDEKIFKIIKFKSITDKKDRSGNLLPDSERVTTFGTFIRKTSLDEIPQLINIIKGDMSLVGPRPLRVRYLPYYTNEERIRHSIRPGVTGLAQVSGRNLLSWDEKLALDIKYVESISFVADLIILIKTIKKVLLPSGIELDPNLLNLDELRSKNSNKR